MHIHTHVRERQTDRDTETDRDRPRQTPRGRFWKGERKKAIKVSVAQLEEVEDVSDLWPTDCMWPRMAMNPAENSETYLKHYKISFSCNLFCNLITWLSSTDFVDGDMVLQCQKIEHPWQSVKKHSWGQLHTVWDKETWKEDSKNLVFHYEWIPFWHFWRYCP